MSKLRKDQEQIIKDAEKRGWSSRKSRGGHIRLEHPRYRTVFTSATPSDFRTLNNLKAQLRRSERRATRT